MKIMFLLNLKEERVQDILSHSFKSVECRG